MNDLSKTEGATGVAAGAGVLLPLLERERILQAIPECPVHGACVPHALEWVEEMKRRQA